MNFSFESIKRRADNQNEDFYFETETPHGHFHALVDFAAHDYANLNATLKGKLETIVASFASLSSFSAELFLGFLAKEVNNFLHNLTEQARGPELPGSAVLCLIDGNQLAYFACGDAVMKVLRDDRITNLAGEETQPVIENFGPLGARNAEAPLNEHVRSLTLHDDDYVLVMTQGIATALHREKLESLALPSLSESGDVSRALIEAGGAGVEDASLLVISGPFEMKSDATLADLTLTMADLRTRVTVLEGALASVKQNSDHVERQVDRGESLATAEYDPPFSAQPARGFYLKTAALVIGLGLAAGFLGAWLQSRFLGTRPASRPAAVATSQPTPIAQPSAQPSPATQPQLTEITLKAGDSLKKIAARYNVPPERIMELNPTVNQWPRVRIGTRIMVPTQPAVASPPAPGTTGTSPSGTTEITVGPGDSINRLAMKYSSTPERLRELNPQITNWSAIYTGQKIIVPAPPG